MPMMDPVHNYQLELLGAEACRWDTERHDHNDYISFAVPWIAGPQLGGKAATRRSTTRLVMPRRFRQMR
jgi:hypothetical protein